MMMNDHWFRQAGLALEEGQGRKTISESSHRTRAARGQRSAETSLAEARPHPTQPTFGIAVILQLLVPGSKILKPHPPTKLRTGNPAVEHARSLPINNALTHPWPASNAEKPSTAATTAPHPQHPFPSSARLECEGMGLWSHVCRTCADDGVFRDSLLFLQCNTCHRRGEPCASLPPLSSGNRCTPLLERTTGTLHRISYGTRLGTTSLASFLCRERISVPILASHWFAPVLTPTMETALRWRNGHGSG